MKGNKKMIEQLGVNRNLLFFYHNDRLRIYRIEVEEDIIFLEKHKPAIGDNLTYGYQSEWVQFGKAPTIKLISTVVDDNNVTVRNCLSNHIFHIYVTNSGSSVMVKWVNKD